MSDIVPEQGSSRALTRLASLSAVLSDALNGAGPPLLFAINGIDRMDFPPKVKFWA